MISAFIISLCLMLRIYSIFVPLPSKSYRPFISPSSRSLYNYNYYHGQYHHHHRHNNDSKHNYYHQYYPSRTYMTLDNSGKDSSRSINKSNSNGSNSKKSSIKREWISVTLGNKEKGKGKEIEMNERLKQAEGWVSKKLSNEDAKRLNEMLGIEMEYLNEDEDTYSNDGSKDNSSSSNSLSNRKNKISGGRNSIKKNQNGITSKVEDFISDDSSFDAKVKGFLELNPQLCSGCGAPFQTKSVDNPGYLSSDKFQEHKQNAMKIRSYQDAIKILYEASIDLNSSAAEELLREANVSNEIIQGVKMFSKKESKGRNISKSNDITSSPNISQYRSKKDINIHMNMNKIPSDEGIDLINDINEEVNPIKYQRIIKMSDIRNGFLNDLDNSTPVLPTQQEGKQVEDNEENSSNISSEININNSYDDEGSTVIDPICVCQRCFKLQQYGTVEQSLRPGWSSHDLLTPERFEFLLGEIKKTNAVVLCLIDLFDLHGSLLPNLREIAGNNPIVIAANKIDLLPMDASEVRLRNWIVSEVRQYCNLQSPKEVEQEQRDRLYRIQSQEKSSYVKKVDETGILRSENVHLISCQSGKNVDTLLGKVMLLAEERGQKIYVMGAANVGKSSFINRLLSGVDNKKPKSKQTRKVNVPHPTVSNLPGTTLDFLKIRLPNGITVIDTPGLINKGQLTAKLTTDELKKVIPSKPVNAITLRVSEGKTVLVGGLARIELTEGRPFYFTFYISNEIKLHPTDSSKADEFIQKHIGSLVFPPDNQLRLDQLGALETKEFEIQGDSWKKGTTDIVIAGLGWIMITGPGIAKVKVTVPQGTSVGIRGALLPFEATFTTAKFTGGKLLKKSGRSGGQGSNSNYGWRA